MRIWLSILLCFFFMITPVSALEYEAPKVPDSGADLMPENTASFTDGFQEMLRSAIRKLQPDLIEAGKLSSLVIVAVLLISVISVFEGDAQYTAELAGAVTIAAMLLGSTNGMILAARDTVQQISSYGKLLLPVMTGALAAQGGVSASAGLYVGTAFFNSLLSSLLTKLFVPFVYLYIILSLTGSISGEDVLKKMRTFLKNSVTWSLKTILTVFTTYMSITGVVSGTTDAAALKATKVTISTMIPVVGGVLSDTSEAILVGAGVMKNAAGIYGIFALLAVCLGPFLRIGSYYLLLQGTAAICSIFGTKTLSALIEDFSCAMGLLLAITGSLCLLFLISTVCFMKGVA